ncbi:cytochrome c oxidase assembly protein COX11, mitochondrial-like isoform X2 [Centruroides sculpturatus]|nr:cytochrome c oxidase assembly protein COX11, mitochondrial-like isoform X2 [Centruroides sculpturatus]XP_023228471.1 cytochrome c oxidase assembly protein COX11, mitochondrial-like isoform X2 [Centruroides sculpturatus]XP_023228472.1 cytochrome c oxidase assembly protein COX11, mitochondrial-like isoform X2 [Centruroides sculpturatus]
MYLCVSCIFQSLRTKSFYGITNKLYTSSLVTKCKISRYIYCKTDLPVVTWKNSIRKFNTSKQYLVSYTDNQKFKNRTTRLYITGFVLLFGGLSYAAVPLYRIYCQATGKGGQAVIADDDKIANMPRIIDRTITVHFNADTISSLQWNFKPQQNEIKLVPGETALAFYTARNPTNAPVTGIATYNVLPFEAGQYFNKIQCFCFEEQRLNPDEEVDMPVFFYIDPGFSEDPSLEDVDELTLSYTFFEAKPGLNLPVPTFK